MGEYYDHKWYSSMSHKRFTRPTPRKAWHDICEKWATWTHLLTIQGRRGVALTVMKIKFGSDTEWWSQYILSCTYGKLGVVSSTVTRFGFLLLVMLSLSAKWFRIMLTTTSCLTMRLSISIDGYRFATLLQCPTHAAYGTPQRTPAIQSETTGYFCPTTLRCVWSWAPEWWQMEYILICMYCH